MTRTEENEILQLWRTWSVNKTITNQTFTDFFFEVVRRDRRVRHCNVFEVLDFVVNAPEEVENSVQKPARAG